MPHRLALFNHQRFDLPLQRDLLRLGVSHLKPSQALLVAVLLGVTYGDDTPTAAAWWWMAAAACAALFGFAYRAHWKPRLMADPSREVLKRAELWGIAYGSSVGLVWGCSSFLMQHGQDGNLMIAMVYFGMCAGATTLSMMGMAHMVIGSAVVYLGFAAGMPLAYPSHWLWFDGLLLLYHLIVVSGALERQTIVANNLLLLRRQDQLLADQQKETARANQANLDKSAFLAAASHDLRQPVHAIMLLGHALDARPLDDTSRGLVSQVVDAGKALSDQFNSLMELSRLESGRHPLQAQTTPLMPWLQRRHQAWVGIARARSIALRLRVHRPLHTAQLHADTDLLQRALDNLLDNAIKFSEPNRRILLTARRHGGRLQLAIWDQGSGIPATSHEQVFLPHVQLSNPTRDRARGIGLGLSIVRQAVALLGGETRLRSQPGHGSCFVVDLPAQTLRAFPAAEALPAPVLPSPPEGLRSLQGRHLLLVEDDAMVARALQDWAQARGLHTTHVHDPATVTDLQGIDLILCDIRLPGERDGIEWLSQWLSDWPDAAGLLLSGEAGAAVHSRAEQEGLILLTKPVDPVLLQQTLIGLCR